MPDMYSLKGGSEWANNGKTIIICDRNFQSGITDIKIDKAKPKIVGVQGIASLRYDIKKGGFYENINHQRHYGHKEPVIVQKTDPNVIQDFEEDEKSTNDDLPF